MGSILINVPDISDADLIYDELETKQILKFFWPLYSQDIEIMQINNDARRLAQTVFVAAIDGSYAMGFIQAIVQSVLGRPKPNIKSLAQKLGKKFIKNWWKHVNQSDLNDAKIYESIRLSISNSLRTDFLRLRDGLALGQMKSFYAQLLKSRTAWV